MSHGGEGGKVIQPDQCDKIIVHLVEGFRTVIVDATVKEQNVNISLKSRVFKNPVFENPVLITPY